MSRGTLRPTRAAALLICAGALTSIAPATVFAQVAVPSPTPTVTPAAAAISLTPRQGPYEGGNSVAISGSGVDFSDVTAVRFAESRLPSSPPLEATITSTSATEIVVTMPASRRYDPMGVGVGLDMEIVHASGPSDTVSRAYRYIGTTATPEISGVYPATITYDAANPPRVELRANAEDATQVLVNGVPSTNVSPREGFVAFTPPNLPAGTYDVQVVTPFGGTSPVSAAAKLTYLAPPTPSPTPEATQQLIPYAFSLSGSSQLRTLTTGTVPLAGSITAMMDVLTGEFEADLELRDTRARLTIIGLIPVTASVQFVQSGKTTGSLKAGKLTTHSRMKIRLPRLYLFGAIPVGGANCQTRQYSTIDLASTEDWFQPLDGGPLTGTYAISDLTGCGALNGLISPLTQGGGNTINVSLTPAPLTAPAAS